MTNRYQVKFVNLLSEPIVDDVIIDRIPVVGEHVFFSDVGKWGELGDVDCWIVKSVCNLVRNTGNILSSVDYVVMMVKASDL